MAVAQRCLEGGKMNDRRGETMKTGTLLTCLIFHQVICPSGPQEKRNWREF